MKVFLIAAAALGFTASVAAAECAGHPRVAASVDTETTTASIKTKEHASTTEAALLRTEKSEASE